MTKEFLMKTLAEKGFQVEETKENVSPGIIVGDGAARPIVYAKMYERIPEDEIDKLIDLIKESISNVPQVLTEGLLTDWNWVKSRLRLCLHKISDEHICKRSFLDLEQYVRVMIDEEEGMSYKVTPKMLKIFEITEDELFAEAAKCTRPLIKQENMNDVITRMLSSSEYVFPQSSMIVVGNESCINGASAICFPDVLKEIADNFESNLIILPSSIHECILYPVYEQVSIAALNEIINEVNKNELEPDEVLSNHAYYYDRKKEALLMDF